MLVRILIDGCHVRRARQFKMLKMQIHNQVSQSFSHSISDLKILTECQKYEPLEVTTQHVKSTNVTSHTKLLY